MRVINFSEGIKEATVKLLQERGNIVVVGLGANYDKGLDGTIGDIHKQFPGRVLDTPLSEAANGNACVGMALNGLRPIFHNGRTEFALFAIDSIVTQASKWHYMFGGEAGSCPITFRIAVGRAWGSGPQHSQSLYPLWANCTGLKAVVPSTPQMARDLLYSAVLDNNPVAYIEPRWLYNIKESVSDESMSIPLDKARIVTSGNDLTIVTYAEGVYEALVACSEFKKKGYSIEVIDLVSINPIDYNTIYESVRKTGRILFVESANSSCSIGRDVISDVLLSLNPTYKALLTCPHVPIPAATSLTEEYYVISSDIIRELNNCLGEDIPIKDLNFADLHLSPSTDITCLI
jgi:pyruvate dehydrogenase E1 component beta subunit